MTLRRIKYGPTDAQAYEQQEQYYLHHMRDPQHVRDAMSDMTDEEALAFAMAGEVQAHEIKEKVIRRYLRQLVESDMVDWHASFDEDMQARLMK